PVASRIAYGPVAGGMGIGFEARGGGDSEFGAGYGRGSGANLFAGGGGGVEEGGRCAIGRSADADSGRVFGVVWEEVCGYGSGDCWRGGRSMGWCRGVISNRERTASGKRKKCKSERVMRAH